ncbi:MAG: hypothetical protein ACUVUU_03155 [bacterium]
MASQNTFSIDIGYVYTADGKYGDGLTYGFSIVETTRWISFAIVARLFSNSNSYLAPDNQRKFEEIHRDFFVMTAATLNLRMQDGSAILSLGLGPQIHFLSATKHHISEHYSQTARESRLGVGLFLRYYRRIEIFGGTAFVSMISQSWTQEGSPPIDPYEYVVPIGAVHPLTATIGIGFDF